MSRGLLVVMYNQVAKAHGVWKMLAVMGWIPSEPRLTWAMCLALVKEGDYGEAARLMEEEKKRGELPS